MHMLFSLTPRLFFLLGPRLFFLLGMLLFAAPGQAVELTLNLKGADMTTLVETVAQATGQNFILDPQIKGKVTVISSKPMTEKDLYRMFLTILEVYGYIAVPTDGGAIKIIPDAQLKFSGEMKEAEKTNGSEVVTRVFKLKHVNANRLLGALRPMASPQAHMAAYEDGNMLILTDHADVTDRLAMIVQRVDLPSEGEIEVIVLENAAASEVARVINALEQGNINPTQPPGQAAKPPAVADERTNSILLGGDKSTRLRLRTIITHLDTPVEITGNTRVVNLRYASAKKMVDVLGSMGQDYLKTAQKEKRPDTGIVNVQPYEGTNALVITAPPALLKSMQDVIRRLDVRQAQVQVEAIIVEVSASKVADLGVQWGVLGSSKGKTGMITGTNFPNASPGLLQVGGLLAKGFTDTAAVGLGSSVGAGLILGGSDGDHFAALLRALNNDSSSNVLSTPTVVTLDNEEAEIMVGSKISLSTGQTNTIAGGNPFTTITRESVGLTLKVKPQISEGNVVRMDIHQEVSDIGKVDSFGNRDTDNRTIKTSVLVDDQQILVLGGLIRNGRKQNMDKVPLLGDIPVIGSLFRLEHSEDDKKNLMVFLRPAILRTRDDGIALTHDKYQSMRNQQLSAPKIQGPVTLEGEGPLLPDLPNPLRLERELKTPAPDASSSKTNQEDGSKTIPRPPEVNTKTIEPKPKEAPPPKATKTRKPKKPTPSSSSLDDPPLDKIAMLAEKPIVLRQLHATHPQMPLNRFGEEAEYGN